MLYSVRKARLNTVFALSITLGLFSLVSLGFWVAPIEAVSLQVLGTVGALCLAVWLFRRMTRKFRERAQLRQSPFPKVWRDILTQHVTFYKTLDAADKERFEREVQLFLHETRVTGIKTDVDTTTLVLVAASAIIPIFGFEDWEYDNIGEVLIFPKAFNRNLQIEGEQRQVLGMVGTGVLKDKMILSKSALYAGFQQEQDRKNVGIHEFVHLLDGLDGAFDGVPEVLLERQYILPWLDCMHKEMQRIETGESSMNPYGGTSPVEFFAVASEYFFERPDLMKRKKPELYALMRKIFKQHPAQQLKMAVLNLGQYTGKKIKRNDACPCGSGKKYKHCCLRNARRIDAHGHLIKGQAAY